ncbi:hypothetical protein CDL15_Pgr024836 [Punica granatum]|uniref:Uncharacterized protein n=1 Tax=Punica granatum TaxID=22663 RepID=A0A218WIW1_PUNGR|nr:hypothetical protein CDL15_Pgr024836 [Punica granatum]
MLYLASGYKKRVGEVFESRVTRLNAWKGARVQRMHDWQRWASGRTSGARTGMRACAAASGYGCTVHLKSMSFTQNDGIDLKS